MVAGSSNETAEPFGHELPVAVRREAEDQAARDRGQGHADEHPDHHVPGQLERARRPLGERHGLARNEPLCLRLQRESRVRRWDLDGRGRGGRGGGARGRGVDVASPLMPQTQMLGWPCTPPQPQVQRTRAGRADTAPMALLALTGEAP
jgi:hypothetical protein